MRVRGWAHLHMDSVWGREKNPSLNHFNTSTLSRFFFFFRSCVTEFLCHCWLQSGHPPPFTTWPETSVTNRINHSFLKTNCYPEKTLNSFLSFTKLWLKNRCMHTGKESKEGCEKLFFLGFYFFYANAFHFPPKSVYKWKKDCSIGMSRSVTSLKVTFQHPVMYDLITITHLWHFTKLEINGAQWRGCIRHKSSESLLSPPLCDIRCKEEHR